MERHFASHSDHPTIYRLQQRKARARGLRLYLRRRRHRELSRLLEALPPPVRVLDVGGSPFFWETVEAASRCRITLLNLDDAPDARDFRTSMFASFDFLFGDACDMPQVDTDSFDFVVCNSVLEHVGSWPRIQAAAHELTRVARHGWVQVPAVEFPIESHLMLPMLHWFNRSLQRRMVQTVHGVPADEARILVDRLNLLSKTEMRLLFRHATIWSERLCLLPKSHIAIW